MCIIFLYRLLPLGAYTVIYKEEFYRLYHVHYQQRPDDVIENIYWLEKAVKADFCNPKFAFAKIETETDWEKYRSLFMMHLSLKLIEQHLRLGKTWDIQAAHFYDAPWKDAYLRDLETTDKCYRAGLYYWEEAKKWAEQAAGGKFRFLVLTGVQNWEDERERITNGKLDYGKIITRELSRIENLKQTFQNMDENTY
ncbi:MAG: hypothetical protein LBS97_00210 [Treponema sp.]|nr:hypothetical protein [Treponema sp.]